MTNDQIIVTLAKIKNHTERLKHVVYDAWKQNNADYSSSGGVATSSSALKGAKAAMNDKYGTGSVEW